MQNVLKQKNMYFYEKICSFGPVLILDYSGSFNTHIEEKKNPQKNSFCCTGGGLRTLRIGTQLIGFFLLTPSLTHSTHICSILTFLI